MATSTIGPGYDALTPSQKARITFMRFGLGPKPGGPSALLTGPNAALNALRTELTTYDPTISDNAVLFTPRNNDYLPQNAPLTYANCCMIGRMESGSPNISINDAEQTARLVKQLTPPIGFVEQLVIFWSNHFSVSLKKGSMVRATVGQMERGAIRANVLGKFSDMLKAVITHPAMTFYLDNQNSIGPNSPLSQRARKGFSYNENLAREILELHTVGFDGGYTQADVTTLAKVITGWTVYPGSANLADRPGQFYFEPDRHEPGPATVMSQSFPQLGFDQGLAVLNMLAAHPKTARHIARKLLQYFVCDDPSENDIAYLANVFINTQGDLRQLALALIGMDVAWSTPLNRLRQPYPWMVSMLRGLQVTDLPRRENNVQSLLLLMDQGIWSHVTPDGFAAENYAWMTGNTVRLRKDVAGGLVNMFLNGSPPYSPASRAAQLLSQGVPESLAAAMVAFKDPRQSLAMLFVTPEFMRR